MKEIEGRSDVETLVNTFYGKVREDELIGPIFNNKIDGNWEPHLHKMYGFWENILFGNNAYSGRPFPPHAQLNIDVHHFERWLTLFHQTVDELFKGDLAEEAKNRSTLIARVFLGKLEMIRNPQ